MIRSPFLGIIGIVALALAAQQPATKPPAGPGQAAGPIVKFVPAPLPDAAPRVGTYNYKGKLKKPDGESDVRVIASIEDASDGWKVVDTVVTIAGKTTINLLLDRRTLTIRRDYMRRSGMNVVMEFKDGKVEGQLSSRAGAHPVHGETQPLLAATAANGQMAACLPLAEGYRANYSGFDSIDQRQMLVELQVRGSERVTGPAGTFDTYKTKEVFSDPEKPDQQNRRVTTLWVDKATRVPVKVETAWGSEPGAMRLTTELVP